jgi:hypothetical protein
MDRGPALRRAREIAIRRAATIPGLRTAVSRAAELAQRRRRLQIIQHDLGGRSVAAAGVIVPDKTPSAEDVAIAERLLRAFRAATEGSEAGSSSQTPDLWTIITAEQGQFASVLRRGDGAELAGYLCNVCRHDATIGIVQGNDEYARIVSDRSYRDSIALMAKDKLVSLAEAVGSLPVENPEQGPFGMNLHVDADDLVAGISQRIGIDITPPDVDGGLFKLSTSGGLFGERDANAIFTALLLRRLSYGSGTPRICEIGAGSGRVAYWSRRLGSSSHTIIDLPHVNVVQGYYLLKSVPAERVRLYGEDSSAVAPELTIWPNHAIGELRDAEYEIVLNQDSMPEMSRSTVDDYLRWIGRTCRHLFVSINQESRPTYGDDLQQVSVPEAAAAVGGFELLDRYPYWLRRGFVVELYRTR